MKKFCFIFSQLICAYSLSLSALSYTIHDVGTLETHKSLVRSINNHGIISGIKIDEDNERSYFIWQPGKGVVSLSLEATSQIPVINNQNQLAGLYWHRTDYWLVNNITTKHLFLLQPNLSFHDIGAPSIWDQQQLEQWQTPSIWDEEELAIIDFNDLGQLLIADSADANKRTKVAIWQKGTFSYIDSSTLSNAYAFNNQGIILGRQWISNEKGKIPMLGLYDPIKDLFQPIIKDVNILSCHLNDRGQVILVKKQKNPNGLEGLLWEAEAGFTLLNDFYPLALNNKDQIIGYQSMDGNFFPALWNKGEIIDLMEAIDLENSHSAWADIETLKAINDSGVIIGEGKYDNHIHAFFLAPSENKE